MSLAALIGIVFLVSMALTPFGAYTLFHPLNSSRDDTHQDIESYFVAASCVLACSLGLILLSFVNELSTNDLGYLKFARRLGGISIGVLFVMLLAFICLVWYPHTQKKFEGGDYLPPKKSDQFGNGSSNNFCDIDRIERYVCSSQVRIFDSAQVHLCLKDDDLFLSVNQTGG